MGTLGSRLQTEELRNVVSIVDWRGAIAPLPLTWVLVGTLALLFARRLYRELQKSPPGERSP
jgi:hypothetical protein